jgi:hypothetical protein
LVEKAYFKWREILQRWHCNPRSQDWVQKSAFHTTAAVEKERAGKYRVTVNRSRPLTYEMAFRPQEIATKKGFNSFNTAQLVSGC